MCYKESRLWSEGLCFLQNIPIGFVNPELGFELIRDESSFKLHNIQIQSSITTSFIYLWAL